MPPQRALVERFQLFILPGTDIPTAAASIIHELTSPPPPGFLSGSWGTMLEDPNKIEFWLTWDTLASHVSFSTPAKVTTITQILIPIAAAMPVVYHVAFTSEFRPPASNAVAEVLSFTPAPKEVRLPSAEDLEGCVGHVQGKAVERVEGRKVYVVVAWWDDKDGMGSHRRIEGLRVDGAKQGMKIEGCHVRLHPF